MSHLTNESILFVIYTPSEFIALHCILRLIWAEDGLTFDSQPGNARKKELSLVVNSKILQRSGSDVWAHIYLAKSGAPLWQCEEGYSARYLP